MDENLVVTVGKYIILVIKAYFLIKHAIIYWIIYWKIILSGNDTDKFPFTTVTIVPFILVSRIEEFNESNLPNKELNNPQEIDKDELLIYHVSQKRALFDHRIPASERSTLKKNTLWQEISNSLGG